MREKRWTPGPWYKVHVHPDPDTIAGELACIYGCSTADGRANANAILMAAAPDLVEALETFLAETPQIGPPNALYRRYDYARANAEAALAKAYGESHD